MSKDKEQWGIGVVLSFDLITSKLRRYYSTKSPQGAYEVIKIFLENNGFDHKKDSDYVNQNLNRTDTVRLLYKFSKDNKWFPLCVNKMNISPNVETLDVSTALHGLIDDEFKRLKDKENNSLEL